MVSLMCLIHKPYKIWILPILAASNRMLGRFCRGWSLLPFWLKVKRRSGFVSAVRRAARGGLRFIYRLKDVTIQSLLAHE